MKLKEENAKKKISRPVGDFLKNVFTEDGENPRDEIPPIIKQMMKDTADTTAMDVDLLLNKSQTPGKPLPGFIKALNKGNYTHPTGEVGGLTPLAIPFTGYGKGQENFDTT